MSYWAPYFRNNSTVAWYFLISPADVAAFTTRGLPVYFLTRAFPKSDFWPYCLANPAISAFSFGLFLRIIQAMLPPLLTTTCSSGLIFLKTVAHSRAW